MAASNNKPNTPKKPKNPLLTGADLGFPFENLCGSAILMPIAHEETTTSTEDINTPHELLQQELSPPPPPSSSVPPPSSSNASKPLFTLFKEVLTVEKILDPFMRGSNPEPPPEPSVPLHPPPPEPDLPPPPLLPPPLATPGQPRSFNIKKSTPVSLYNPNNASKTSPVPLYTPQTNIFNPVPPSAPEKSDNNSEIPLYPSQTNIFNPVPLSSNENVEDSGIPLYPAQTNILRPPQIPTPENVNNNLTPVPLQPSETYNPPPFFTPETVNNNPEIPVYSNIYNQPPITPPENINNNSTPPSFQPSETSIYKPSSISTSENVNNNPEIPLYPQTNIFNPPPISTPENSNNNPNLVPMYPPTTNIFNPPPFSTPETANKDGTPVSIYSEMNIYNPRTNSQTSPEMTPIQPPPETKPLQPPPLEPPPQLTPGQPRSFNIVKPTPTFNPLSQNSSLYSFGNPENISSPDMSQFSSGTNIFATQSSPVYTMSSNNTTVTSVAENPANFFNQGIHNNPKSNPTIPLYSLWGSLPEPTSNFFDQGFSKETIPIESEVPLNSEIQESAPTIEFVPSYPPQNIGTNLTPTENSVESIKKESSPNQTIPLYPEQNISNLETSDSTENSMEQIQNESVPLYSSFESSNLNPIQNPVNLQPTIFNPTVINQSTRQPIPLLNPKFEPNPNTSTPHKVQNLYNQSESNPVSLYDSEPINPPPPHAQIFNPNIQNVYNSTPNTPVSLYNPLNNLNQEPASHFQPQTQNVNQIQPNLPLNSFFTPITEPSNSRPHSQTSFHSKNSRPSSVNSLNINQVQNENSNLTTSSVPPNVGTIQENVPSPATFFSNSRPESSNSNNQSFFDNQTSSGEINKKPATPVQLFNPNIFRQQKTTKSQVFNVTQNIMQPDFSISGSSGQKSESNLNTPVKLFDPSTFNRKSENNSPAQKLGPSPQNFGQNVSFSQQQNQAFPPQSFPPQNSVFTPQNVPTQNKTSFFQENINLPAQNVAPPPQNTICTPQNVVASQDLPSTQNAASTLQNTAQNIAASTPNFTSSPQNTSFQNSAFPTQNAAPSPSSTTQNVAIGDQTTAPSIVPPPSNTSLQTIAPPPTIPFFHQTHHKSAASFFDQPQINPQPTSNFFNPNQNNNDPSASNSTQSTPIVSRSSSISLQNPQYFTPNQYPSEPQLSPQPQEATFINQTPSSFFPPMETNLPQTSTIPLYNPQAIAQNPSEIFQHAPEHKTLTQIVPPVPMFSKSDDKNSSSPPPPSIPVSVSQINPKAVHAYNPYSKSTASQVNQASQPAIFNPVSPFVPPSQYEPSQSLNTTDTSVASPPPPPKTMSGSGGNSYRLGGNSRPQYAPPPGLGSSVSAIASLAASMAMSTPLPVPGSQTRYEPPFIPSTLPTIVTNAPGVSSAAELFKPSSVPVDLNTATYRPVYHHWFYKRDIEGRHVWMPFSMLDSQELEKVHLSGDTNVIVATDGGRYDVHVADRRREPVYWSQPANEVRRCSWFYRGALDSRSTPYEENFAERLEEEYRSAFLSNRWPHRVEMSFGEAIILNGPINMLHLPPTSGSILEDWGTIQEQGTKPRTVRRGCDEFDIDEGEPGKPDHLLFLVHGIGSACDLKFRSVVEVVDDFRTMALTLVRAHFRQAGDDGRVTRVEVLPVSWHSALHGEETGIDKQLQGITLKSIPRLRHFTNDTLLDILFYTSPVYCQTIIRQVGHELNRLQQVFLRRNPDFTGGISLGGHSLGSLILFDLLCHQRPPPAAKAQTTSDPLMFEGEEDEDEFGEPMPPPRHLRRRESCRVDYMMGPAGTGQPSINYPQLHFSPMAFFALGSPIAMFVTVRGIESLGQDFCLPTCPQFFNIFHPFDPVAYRIEALINPELSQLRPVVIPHHKGRKRMHIEIQELMTGFKEKVLDSVQSNINVATQRLGLHLSQVGTDLRDRLADSVQSTVNLTTLPVIPELRETMARVGTDLKERIVDSVRSTWNTVYQLAMFNRGETLEQEVDKVLAQQLLAQDAMAEDAQQAEMQDTIEPDPQIVGRLNNGRRVDYVLQEAPLESFNEYLFALGSHVCYWESEDTMLMMLREIYLMLGINPDRQMDRSRESSMVRDMPRERSWSAGSKGSPSPSQYFLNQNKPTPPCTPPNLPAPPTTGFVRRQM